MAIEIVDLSVKYGFSIRSYVRLPDGLIHPKWWIKSDYFFWQPQIQVSLWAMMDLGRTACLPSGNPTCKWSIHFQCHHFTFTISLAIICPYKHHHLQCCIYIYIHTIILPNNISILWSQLCVNLFQIMFSGGCLIIISYYIPFSSHKISYPLVI
jgi:hypothetical protein